MLDADVAEESKAEGKGCEHPDDDARRLLAPREPPCNEPGHGEDRRKGEVELLLDGERPVVEDG